MTFAQLFQILVSLALVESPNLHNGSDKSNRYLASIETMAHAYVEVGQHGQLITPAADVAMLAVIGYEESRHRPKVVDGDCVGSVGINRRCKSAGPMQLSRAIVGMMPHIDAQWSLITEAHLHDPSQSVGIAYRLLKYYQDGCKGAPANWLGAYAAGKCSARPIELGRRRCAMASAILRAAGDVPLECGTYTPDKRTAQRIAAILATKVTP